MDYLKMLKEIMRLSGWTQEQIATRLGVSFATVNSWLNGKSTPREGAMKMIEKLYLSQDVTGEAKPVYITIVQASELSVGDYVLLEKDDENVWDDEAIKVSLSRDGATAHGMYVANSVPTVARGTYSAGRLYDKFEALARAQVMFVLHETAIARVVDWNATVK